MGEEKRKCLMPRIFPSSWKALVCLGLLLDQHKAKVGCSHSACILPLVSSAASLDQEDFKWRRPRPIRAKPHLSPQTPKGILKPRIETSLYFSSLNLLEHNIRLFLKMGKDCELAGIQAPRPKSHLN